MFNEILRGRHGIYTLPCTTCVPLPDIMCSYLLEILVMCRKNNGKRRSLCSARIHRRPCETGRT